MKKEICYICKVRPAESWHGTCPSCHPVARIVSTSAEDGIKYGIPHASLLDLERARAWERRHCKRKTILDAIARTIKKYIHPKS